MPNAPAKYRRPGVSSTRPHSGKSEAVVSRLRAHRTKAWEQFRLEVIVHFQATCQKCGAFPIKGRNAHVDHIVPVQTREDVERYEMSEVQLLCESCHNTKSRHEQIERGINV